MTILTKEKIYYYTAKCQECGKVISGGFAYPKAWYQDVNENKLKDVVEYAVETNNTIDVTAKELGCLDKDEPNYSNRIRIYARHHCTENK